MKNFSGFTLIELLIGTAISGILLSLLFVTLSQINRTKKNLDNSIRKSSRVSLVHSLTERDLMGAFVPIVPEVPEEPEEEKKPEPQKPGEQKKPEEPKKEEKKEDKKPPKPKVDKIFFSENKGANIQTLTFISNNPMPVYWSKKAGKPQPKIVRVVYRLQPDPARRNAFRLMRQEGDDLSYDFYDAKIPAEKQKYRPYEVVDGIKNFSAVYYYVPVKKQTPGKAGEKKEEPKIEYRTTKEWGKLKREEQEKAGIPPLPRYVELTLVLWDNAYQRDSTWKFTIPILPTSQLPTKSNVSVPQQKTENKPAQPAATVPTTGAPTITPSTSPAAPATPIKTSFNLTSEFKAGIQPGVHVGPHWDKLPSSSVNNRFNTMSHRGNS